MDRRFTIYAHINKLNGKMYIGQTGVGVKKRWANGKGYRDSTYFNHAIQKYGWDNFEHVVIVDKLTVEEANVLEEELIREFKTTDHNYGYNLREGGKNAPLPKYEIEYLRKLRIKTVYQYDLEGNFIREWESAQVAGKELDVTPSKISACCTGVSQTSVGYRWSYEKKNKEEFEPIIDVHVTPVKQYDRYGNYITEYSSIKEAAEINKVNTNSISYGCQNHGIPVTNNYRWTYLDETLNKEGIKKLKPVNQEIIQFGLDGEFIKKWDNIKEIKKTLGITTNSRISACCRGESNTAYGYIWRYGKEEKVYIENVDELLKRKERKQAKPKFNIKMVVQYDMDGNFIRIWNSAKEATEAMGGKSNTIHNCCSGMKEKAFGYKWKYLNDVIFEKLEKYRNRTSFNILWNLFKISYRIMRRRRELNGL